MIEMASLRLNAGHRDALRRLAKETISCPTEQADRDRTHARAVEVVKAIVERKWPVTDMLVLLKYEQAYRNHQIKIQLTAGGVTQFEFDMPPFNGDAIDDSHLPLVPCNEGRTIYAADERETMIIETARMTGETLKTAIKTKLADYLALIEHSTTLEQVEEIWPAAGPVVRERAGRTLPVALSDDVVNRIKADQRRGD